MTPPLFFQYGAALAGSLFLILLVCALFLGVWFYFVGSVKGRGE